MKTIEKIAQKTVEKFVKDRISKITTYEEKMQILNLEKLCINAINEVQQWISPIDEMPPAGELVQVKVKWRDDHNITYDHDKLTVGNVYDDFEINQMVGLEVVGWRPINLK